MQEKSPIERSLLTGLSLVAPVSPFMVQPEIAAIVRPAERSQTEENVLTNVPVFVEEGAELDVSDIRAIENDVNLRPTPSTDKPPVAVLEDGSFVEVQNPPIIGNDRNWVTTTVLYTEGHVITDTTAPENHGYLAVELSGEPVELTTLPPELITALERENIPPISFTGEYDPTKTIEALKGIGGTGDLDKYITNLFGLSPEESQNFVKNAASGKDIRTILQLLTGMAIYQKTNGQVIFDNVNESLAGDKNIIIPPVEIDQNAEGNLTGWRAVQARLPVPVDGSENKEYKEDQFYVNIGKELPPDEQGLVKYELSNTLLSYVQLRELYGDNFAGEAALRAPVISGLTYKAGEVQISADNRELDNLIEDVDSVYLPKYKTIIEFPGDQELAEYAPAGTTVASMQFVDEMITLRDPNGNPIAKLQAERQENGEFVWIPLIEKAKELDFGDPMDYKILINGQEHVPGEQFSNRHNVDANGKVTDKAFEVVSVIANEPYPVTIPIDNERIVTLWMVDTTIPDITYQRGDKNANWTILPPIVVWTDMSGPNGPQGIRNVYSYDETQSEDGIAEFPPGVLIDSTLLEKKVRTNNVAGKNLEGATETEEYRTLREQVLGLYTPGRGYAMKVSTYIREAPGLSINYDNLDDPVAARALILYDFNDAYDGEDSLLNITPVGNQFLTGDTTTLTPGPNGEPDRIDPNHADLSNIQAPILGYVGSGVFFDIK